MMKEMLRSSTGADARKSSRRNEHPASYSSFRTEHDSIGTKKVPDSAYYGVQSLRASENFRITGLELHPEMLHSLVEIKKAAALANSEAGLLDEKKAGAIAAVCDEILAGSYREHFVVDPIQGGAGTSLNMNANEVIANRAIEILGGKKGDYSIVHPNDHVNLSQSTNDVIPTAGRMSALRLLMKLILQLECLELVLSKKADDFDHVIKMGRTQMQDAVPVRLGQEFRAYAHAVGRCKDRLRRGLEELRSVNIGGTAIGTAINADRKYLDRIVPLLCEVSGLELVRADDLIDATQNHDEIASVSGAVKACALTLSKIANDLRLMSSGPKTGFGEISLPPMQNGSSIMPGKVNPVIPEVVNQAAFSVIGNDVTITLAAEAGQLELNAFEPVMFNKLFDSIDTLGYAAETFTDNCIRGIRAEEEKCREHLENSIGIVTVLVPEIGYERSADIAKKALETGKPVREIVIEEKLTDTAQLDRLLDPYSMTEPG